METQRAETSNRSCTLVGPRELRLETGAIPKPASDGILVKVSACGICGSDLHVWKRALLPAGSIMGHEFSGRVVATGEAVQGIPLGARVTANPMFNNLGIGGAAGAFADYVAIPQAKLGQTVHLLPDEVSDEAGALVEPLAVGLHAVKRAGVRAGDRVAVLGSGAIGLSVTAALKAQGVSNIVVADVSERRLSVAKQLGATACFNAATGDTIQFLIGHFGEAAVLFGPPAAAVDVIFECAGVQQTFDTAIKGVRPGGTVLYVASGTPVQLDPNDLMSRELTLRGTLAYGDEFAEAVTLMRTGAVDLTPIISHRYPLDDIQNAFVMQARPADAVKIFVKDTAGR